MPTGKERGSAFLLLLFVVAAAGCGLALLGETWRAAARHELALQSDFVLDAYAAALESYRLATPDGKSYRPQRLAELLEDRRAGSLRRHLRQLYPNPQSGRQDWLLRTDALGIVEVCLPALSPAPPRCRSTAAGR